MKAVVIAMGVATLMAAQAHADGFTCVSESGNLKVKVYDNVNANTGTRTPARMIVSNPNEAAGSKTAAVFNADSGTLTMGETESGDTTKVYVGKVDLRFSQISAKDADLLGSRLADLASVTLAVDFKYGDNLAKGEEVDAQITLEKRDGGIVKEQALCTRYLKGE